MLTVVDLFAGAGGFSLGFELAGFSVPVALEMDKWACDTLHHNHPQTTVLQADIRDYTSPATILQSCPQAPDVVIGGPPCQGFSIAGPAQKDPLDPRNSLFTYFAQWVCVLQPSVFVMENVVGLLSRKNAHGERVLDIIRRTFVELGYCVEIWRLNAAEYGVPQTRERIFIVGHHSTVPLGEPRPTHALRRANISDVQLAFEDMLVDLAPPITVWDAISDLPELEAGQGDEDQPYSHEPENAFQAFARGASTRLYNHVAMHHTRRLVERFKHIQPGMSSSDVAETHGPRRRNGNGELSSKSYDQTNRRLHPSRPSHTIAASFYANFIHPYQHRNLTAREGARLQSFPDRYRFMGKKTVVSHKLLHREQRFGETHLCQYNQIGNAVPPLLARAVACHVKEVTVS